MIPKSGYRFSENIMLPQFNGRVRLSGGDRDRDAEQLMAGGVAHIDAAAHALVPAADLHVERQQMGELEGIFLLREVATVKVVRVGVAGDDIEKVLFHRAFPCGCGGLSTIMEISLRRWL